MDAYANGFYLLIVKKPKNKEELLKVKGFGQVKVEKYVEEIMKILC